MEQPVPIEDRFTVGPSPYWVRLLMGHSTIEQSERGVRLVLGPAPGDRVSDAQIHDYAGRTFRWQPPLRMSVRARFSHPSPQLLGTAGFGLWNDPFTLSGQVTAPPNNIWFFYASPPSAMELVPGVPGWGWKAAALDGGRLPGLAMELARRLLQVPALHSILGRVARTRVRAAEALLPPDLTAWHTYELEWRRDGCVFRVDEQEILSTPCSPTPPLGFVAWVDNQYAVARPEGSFAFGRVAVPQQQWLELSYLRLEPLDRFPT